MTYRRVQLLAAGVEVWGGRSVVAGGRKSSGKREKELDFALSVAVSSSIQLGRPVYTPSANWNG